MRPTILPIAGLVGFGAHGTFFPITGYGDRVLHAQFLYVPPGLLRAFLSYPHVVFSAVPLVTVALDEDLDRRILFEKVGVLRQVIHPLAGEGPLIVRKIDVRELSLRRFARLACRNLRGIGLGHRRWCRRFHRLLRRTLGGTLQRRAAALAH